MGPPTILRLARFARGLTVEALAAITKTDSALIRAIEAGASVMGADGLERWVNENEFGSLKSGVLNLKVTDLVFLADDDDGATCITKVPAVPAKETVNAG